MNSPLRIIARIECRGQRTTSIEYYERTVSAPADATLESLSPYGLEKTSTTPFGVSVKRTYFNVEQYDPIERVLLVSYSLPRSKSYDFTFEMEYGHGFKRNYEMGMPARPTAAAPSLTINTASR